MARADVARLRRVAVDREGIASAKSIDTRRAFDLASRFGQQAQSRPQSQSQDVLKSEAGGELEARRRRRSQTDNEARSSGQGSKSEEGGMMGN